MNESEPLMKHRERELSVKTTISRGLRDKHSGELFTGYGAPHMPDCREGITFIQDYSRNTRSLLLIQKGKHKCKSKTITKAA